MSRLFLALCLLLAPVPARAEPADGALRGAESAALRGDYEEAKFLATSLTKDPSVSRALRPRLYLLMARVATAYEDHEESRKWLVALHEIDPQASLDRYRDPPTMFKVWDEIVASSPAPLLDVETSLKVTARRWLGLAPFGIGHFVADDVKGGAVFLCADATMLFLLVQSQQLAAPMVLLGIYGYELAHLLPSMTESAPNVARHVRRGIGLLPLGAPQARNREYGRAAGFLVVQSAALALAASRSDGVKGRNDPVGLGIFGLAYAFSILDGWIRDPGLPSVAVAPIENGATLVFSGSL